MNLLRWILAIAGVVVLLAIYLWDRRNRRAQSDARLIVADRGASAPVPQLEDAVNVRTRREDPSVAYSIGSISAEAISLDEESFDTDDLPPMHATALTDDAPIATERVPQPVGSRSSTGAYAATRVENSAQRVVASETRLESDSRDSPPEILSPTHLAPPNLTSTSARHGTDTGDKGGGVAARAAKKPVASRKIVALRLSAGSTRVEGARLKALLEAANCRFGKYSIYHRLHMDENAIFSIASMVEPGTFDPYAMSGVQFPGVTLFTQLPGPIDGAQMFEQMLACARELEQGIGGILQDERGQPLTELRAQRLRDEVADFVHLLGGLRV